MVEKKLKHGWQSDSFDSRDLLYKPTTTILPISVDLRVTGFMPPVYDQLQLGSCTANAIASAFQYEMNKQKESSFIPSRLFIYYNERKIEGTVSSDAGAQIRDGIKSVAKLGVCPEIMWTYDVHKFKNKPTSGCFSEALKHLAVKYSRIGHTLDLIKGCLADGSPFPFGFNVPASFEGNEIAKTGILQMPTVGEKFVGGHAVKGVGYDDNFVIGNHKGAILVKNSWNTDWGISGYFWMPYDFITNSKLCSDFWKISLVE